MPTLTLHYQSLLMSVGVSSPSQGCAGLAYRRLPASCVPGQGARRRQWQTPLSLHTSTVRELGGS